MTGHRWTDDDDLMVDLAAALNTVDLTTAEATHQSDPIDPEPDDEPDDDVSPLVDEVSGSALRGLASSAIFMVALAFVAILFLADAPGQRVAAGVLAVGCAFTLHRIGRGGPRG